MPNAIIVLMLLLALTPCLAGALDSLQQRPCQWRLTSELVCHMRSSITVSVVVWQATGAAEHHGSTRQQLARRRCREERPRRGAAGALLEHLPRFDMQV
jgi:hypothetical protein